MIYNSSNELISFIKNNIKYKLGIEWSIETRKQFILIQNNRVLTVCNGDVQDVPVEDIEVVVEFPCDVIYVD